jgi:hypothetical protein
MQDLTHLAANSMTVTSQEGGNLVHDNSPAMTAAGTAPVTPMPPVDSQPDPALGTSGHVKVSTQKQPSGYTPTAVAWKTVG